ncbi:acylaminoacyl-peptidase [Thermoflexales bacterium]|nr:acylaminoacyl-peptidase [Thermoflexales bacterium]
MPLSLDLSDSAPWKQRFKAPRFLLASMARANPARGIVIGNQVNSYQVYAWETASGELRLLTDRSAPTKYGWISPDGRDVYFLADRSGNELGHLVRVPFEGGAFADVTPDLPAYTLRGVSVSRNGKFVAFDAVNKEGFQLYVVHLGPQGELSEPQLIFKSEKEAWGAILSSAGTIAAMMSTARAGGQRRRSLLAIDTDDGHLVNEVWDGPQADIEIVAFAPLADDQRILAMTSRSGFKRPFLWNPANDERLDLDCGDLEGEVVPLDWSPDGAHILLCQLQRGQQQLYTYRLADRTLTRLSHPEGTFYDPLIGVPGEGESPWFGSNEEVWGIWEDSASPTRLIALDAQTGATTRVMIPAIDVPPGHALRSITFPSSDGQEVQAWLGLPDGQPPFPLVFDIHGGPHAVRTNYFRQTGQAWLDHGFAYCALNYRGSMTFGRAFKEQIWGNIGHWELEDLVAAREYLVAQGLAHPREVFLFGESYGGYLTLFALGKRPELWAGGMPMVAIADFALAYEDASDALKSFFAGLFGGTPAQKPEQYAASSPITYAENVRTPILIIQGKHDTRTPPRQIELYEAQMKALGKAIEVEWFEAGHTGLTAEQWIHFQERMMLFAQHILQAQ